MNCLKKFYKFIIFLRDVGSLFFLVFSVWAISGVLTDYDSETEKMVMELLKKNEGFFVRQMEQRKPGCYYEEHVDYYDSMKADLWALLVRAKSIKNNDTTLVRLGYLLSNINELESMHMHHTQTSESCLSILNLEKMLPKFEENFGVILEFEFSKKPKSAKTFLNSLKCLLGVCS